MKRLALLAAFVVGLLVAPITGYTNNVALEPSGGDHIAFVSQYGNDANSGLSWGNAFRTIGKANAVLTRGGDIYIGPGVFVESVAITRQHMSLHGMPGDIPTSIASPTITGDALDIQAPSTVVENLRVTQAPGIYFNGIGINVNGASGSMLRNVSVNMGGWTQGSPSLGGVGLAIVNTETSIFEHIGCHATRLCLQLGNQESATGPLDGATENVFINISASSNYQDVVQFPHSGGNTFSHLRAVHASCPRPVPDIPVFDLRGEGQIWDTVDAEEAACPNTFVISGAHHFFRNFVTGPQTNLVVSGTFNEFQGYTIDRQATVTGSSNVFDELWVLGGFVDQGMGTIVSNPMCRLPSSCTYNPTTRHPAYTLG